MGIPEGKRPLGRPRIRWEENISMDIEESVWEGVDCDDLTQDRNTWPGVTNTANKLSCSVECRMFLKCLPKYWLVKKDSVTASLLIS